MVADADTPSGSLQWDGRIVAIPVEYLSTIGSGPNDTGTLLGVHGYPRAGGPTGTEFLMTPALDVVTRDFIRDIPNAETPGAFWADVAQRAEYREIARVLVRDFRISAADVRPMLQRLYNAAVRNERLLP